MSLNIYSIHNQPKFNKPIYLIGAFESFHLGHYLLYLKALELKENEPDRDIVLVYFADCENLPKLNPNLFTDEDFRLQAFANLDFKYACRLEFKNLHNQEAQVFLDILFSNQENFSIVVGQDFRFGKQARGNIDWLKQNYSTYVVEPLKLPNGNKLSTSFLKDLINLGEFDLVNSYLKFDYGFSAKFIKNQNENVLIKHSNQIISLPDAYYVAYLELNEIIYRGLLTVQNSLLEFHAIDIKFKESINEDCKIYIKNKIKSIQAGEIKKNDEMLKIAKKYFLKNI